MVTGSAGDAVRAESLIAIPARANAINQCGLPIAQTAALLADADLYVGPNSGLLNVAAAVGTHAFGLFGSIPPLTYSRFIHAIVPERQDEAAPGGMLCISPDQVMARIVPYLAGNAALANDPQRSTP